MEEITGAVPEKIEATKTADIPASGKKSGKTAEPKEPAPAPAEAPAPVAPDPGDDALRAQRTSVDPSTGKLIVDPSTGGPIGVSPSQ